MRPLAIHDAPLAAVSDALERELLEGGFLDVAFDPDLGTVTAALVVERLARLPVAVEAAAWALVRPALGEASPIRYAWWKRRARIAPCATCAKGPGVVVLGEGLAHFVAATADFRGRARRALRLSGGEPAGAGR